MSYRCPKDVLMIIKVNNFQDNNFKFDKYE